MTLQESKSRKEFQVTTIYKVANWETIHETAQSRRCKTLTWIALPISLNSNEHQLMLDEFATMPRRCSVRGVRYC